MARQSKQEDNTEQLRRPNFTGWLTTDDDERTRRKWRGATEVERIYPLEQEQSLFGNFHVPASKGNPYHVEIRDFDRPVNSCTCVDYHVSRLGTCKHIEGVLYHLRKSENISTRETQSKRIEIYPSCTAKRDLKLEIPKDALENHCDIVEAVRVHFDALTKHCRQKDLKALDKIAADKPDLLRVSILCETWRYQKLVQIRRKKKKTAFLENEKQDKNILSVLKFPLYSYQRQGVKHLALGERALLADEMGLGKTVQAIGACRVLQNLSGVSRVLVVCPASLKTEWAEQITAATHLSYEIISGPRGNRLVQYKKPQFFTLTNYEQILVDLDDLQNLVKPDIVILDEAQRIKNWRTKTAGAIKRLQSRYAFVLTGTPLENRIDELYSIVQFLDPELLGPLFRFNRDYYKLDNQGRAIGYKNLDKLRRKTRSIMLRRRKADVEGDLPDKTTRHHYLPMTEEQELRYFDYERVVGQIAARARKRPLLPEEFKRLQMGLASMRMMCDTPYILDPNVRDCPKLEELERVLEDMLEDPQAKIIIFSEWVRMLDLVRERIDDFNVGYAWHTGSVPQDRRRIEINRFKEDPECRIFLSSESGGVGLNLQVASNVINLDLPWNPAKLEQRIARAWRKHQKRAVTVVNLITQNSIEHRMVGLLSQKQAIADNVLDGYGGQSEMDLPSSRKAFMEQLEAVLRPETLKVPEQPRATPKDNLRDRLESAFGTQLISAELKSSANGEDIMLAVIDSQESIMQADFRTNPEDPKLELIDRTTHAALVRLAEAGLIQVPEANRDVLPAESKNRNEIEQAYRNRENARKIFEQAARKKKMIDLLTSGGFDAEAEAQATAIATLLLRTLAADIGQDIADENLSGEQAWSVCETLREAEKISQEQQFKLFWICSRDDDASDPDQVDAKLPAALELVSHVKASLDNPIE